MPQTLLDRIREKRPDLLFDGKGNLIEDDKQLVDHLSKKLPAKYRDELRPMFYAPLPEEDKGLLGVLADVGKEVISSRGPTTNPSEEEDVSVGEYLRRTNPRLSKASDEGLARYLKIEKGDTRPTEDILSALSERYRDKQREILDKANKPESPEAEEDSFAEKAFGLASALSPTGALSSIAGADSTRKSDVGFGALDTALSSSGRAIAAGASAIGDSLANLADFSDEERGRVRRSLPEVMTAGQVAGSKRVDEQQANLLVDQALEEKHGPDALAARDALRKSTDDLYDALLVGADERRDRVAGQRSPALKQFVDRIDKAESAEDVALATRDITAELATTPEGLFVLAESVPSLLGSAALRNPYVGLFLGSGSQRLAGAQEGKSGEQRREDLAEDVSAAARGAAVDALGVRLAAGVSKAAISPGAKAGGVIGLGGATEAGGDFAQNPDTSKGELALSGLLGAAFETPAEIAAVRSRELSPEAKQRVEELRSTGDPLDSAEANLIESPPPDLAEERQQKLQELPKGQAELPLEGGGAVGFGDLEQKAREQIAKQRAEAEGFSVEESIVEQYNEALEAGDAKKESLMERALANLRKRQPKVDWESKAAEEKTKAPETSPRDRAILDLSRRQKGVDWEALSQDRRTSREGEQQSLALEGGTQPSQNLERPASTPLEEKRGKVTAALVQKAAKDLTSDKHKFTPEEVRSIRGQTKIEGGDPNLPPREQFARLTEAGQDKVIYDVAQRRAPVTSSVPKDRVDRILNKSAPVERKPKEVAPTLTQVEKVQEKPSQAVLEPSREQELTARVKALPRSSFQARVLRGTRNGQSTSESVRSVLDSLEGDQGVALPKEARELVEEFDFQAPTPTKKSYPAITGEDRGVNQLRAKGFDIRSASKPETEQGNLGEAIAKAFGRQVKWFQGKGPLGVHKPSDPSSLYVNVDRPAARLVQDTVAHELNHSLETKPKYKALVTEALDKWSNDSKAAAVEEKAAKRAERGQPITKAKAEEEVRSDLLAEAFRDKNFWEAVQRLGEPTTVKSVVRSVVETFKRLIGKARRYDSVGGAYSDTILTDINSYRTDLLKALKEAKVATEVVREASKDLNFSLEEDFPSTEATRRAEPVTSQAKTLGGFVASKGLEYFLKATTAKGVASDQAHKASLDLVRGKTALTKEHERLADNLLKVAKRNAVSPQDLNRMIRGETTSSNPDVQQAVKEVRDEIDNMSRKLIDAGAIAARDVPKFEANMGSYVHRSYAAWQRKPGKWKRHLQAVRHDLWDGAINHISTAMSLSGDLSLAKAPTVRRLAGWWGVDLQKNSTKEKQVAALETIRAKLSPEQKRSVYEKVREELANPKSSQNAFVKQYVDAFQGSKTVLKERERLPDWLKEFWGEIEDGTFNALTTLEVQANLLQHALVLDRLTVDLLDADLASETARPGYSQVSGTGGPLAGLWVRDEDLDHLGMINDVVGNPQNQIKEHTAMRAVAEALMNAAQKFTSTAKTSQVLADVSTMSVQALSNAAFSLFFSGRVPTTHLFKGLKAALADSAYHKDWATKGFSREELLRLVELGIASEGAYSVELREAVNEVLGKTLPSGEGLKGTDLEGASDFGMSIFRKVGSAITLPGRKAFQFSDTWARTTAYEMELERMGRWYPEKSKTEREEMAAERVRATWPTNSETAPLARVVGKIGILQPFATFMWENHRNIVNNMAIGIHDMKHGQTADQKRAGAQRVVASGIAVGGWYAVGSALAGAVEGWFDEEDRETSVAPEDLQYLLPDYYENSPFIEPMGVDKNGTLTYVNTGRFNMYEPVSKFAVQVAKGNYDKAADGWVEDVFATGFVTELAMSAWATGYNLSKDDKQGAERAWSDTKRAFYSILPGFTKRGIFKPEQRERQGNPMTDGEMFLEQVGMTVHRADLGTVASRAMRNYVTDSSFYRRDVTGDTLNPDIYDPIVLITTSGEMPTQAEVNDMYADWVEMDREAYQDASKRLRVIEKYVGAKKLEELRKDTNLSRVKLEYLLSGNYKLPSPNDSGNSRSDFYELGLKAEMRRADPDNKEFARKAKEKWAKLRRMIPAAQRNYERGN